MPTLLTDRFAKALQEAFEIHRHQNRKLPEVPMIAHLLSVAALVIEDGGSEDEAIAALLHDAVEDQANKTSFEKIQRDFGENVAEIVRGCTQDKSKPREERRRLYIDSIPGAPESIARVIAADKVHSIISLINAHPQYGDEIWDSFDGKKEDTLNYYRRCAEALAKNGKSRLCDETKRQFELLEKTTGN